ncbi:S-layer homology domain-containing protein [Dysosmobacter sp.]|uniref:S-layer homology domain-containing protein n=1 Tax=Dysosmobacter sp. TaxID=2591382 RepID=UPI003AEF95CF
MVDGAEGEAINRQDYPLVKNLTINGAYTSAVGAFGNSVWGKETLETLTIHAPGEDVTINATAFLRTPLKSVKIEAKKLAFTGDAAFLNTMLLTHVDLTGVDEIVCGTNGKRTFAIGEYQNGGLSAPTRYVYFKDAAARSAMSSQFGGNTATYYLVTNGGTVVGEQDGFSAVVKGGYTAEWHEKADFDDTAVETPVAGKTYYAKWTKSTSVALTSNPAADADGKVSATYTPSGAVTLSVQNPGADWLYVWMKDGKQITGTESSLTLCAPSDSGNYTVKVTAGGSSTDVWISNPVKVTITKADVTNTAKETVHHTFGTTYDVSNLFNIDPNAGEATYALAENTDKNAGAATLEDNILTITKAGTINVSLTTAETDNYNAGSAVTATLIVDKAAPTVKISADQTSLTGSGTVKLTVTSNGVPTEGEIEVTCDNGITVTENTDSTFTAVLPNETKTYTFTASYDGDANHEKASGTCRVSVTRRSSSGGSSSSGRSYAVSTPSAKNGDVTVSPKNASKGDRVTITVTPDKGYELDSLTVKDASGNKLKLTDKGNGKYTFTMPGSKVTVSAEFVEEQAASIFADVPADAYYAKAVEWAVKKGITNGKANGLFGSNDPCTRGQIVTFLWRAAGSPAPKGTVKVPSDVLPGSYCYDAVAWALENGITNGLADGTFGVNNTCTRGQSVTFLYRAMGTAPTTVNGFTDVAADSFCADAVAWAVENGVTNGTSASAFSPSNGCTRAQIVTFLFRAYQGK